MASNVFLQTCVILKTTLKKAIRYNNFHKYIVQWKLNDQSYTRHVLSSWKTVLSKRYVYFKSVYVMIIGAIRPLSNLPLGIQKFGYN